MPELTKFNASNAKNFMVWCCLRSPNQATRIKVEDLLIGLHQCKMYEDMKEAVPDLWKIHELDPESYVFVHSMVGLLEELNDEPFIAFRILFESEDE